MKTPKKTYFILCIIATISFGLVPLFSTFEGVSYFLLSILLLISGFARSSLMVPYLVVCQYFEASGKDKNSIQFWLSSLSFGEIVGMMGMWILFKFFNWKVSFLVAVLVFLLLAVAMNLLTK